MVGSTWSDFIRQGLPTRQNEHWKYADLSFLQEKEYPSPVTLTEEDKLSVQKVVAQKRLPDSFLLVCVNGRFLPDFSDPLLPGMTLSDFSEAPVINANDYPFAHFTSHAATESWLLSLEKEVDKPVHLLFLASSHQQWLTHARFGIHLGQHLRAIVFEEHVALTSCAYLLNQVMQVHLSQSAQLAHYKLEAHNLEACHTAYTAVCQEKDSHFEWLNVALGGAFVRDDLVIRLQDTGAICRTAGFYRLTEDHQYIDQHIDIKHCAAHTRSDMLFKGTADNQSRAVFNGRLRVEKNAHHIEAYQGNHHLLLSRKASMYAKPELEIYADEVKCKHGATTGQLDEEVLFYLRSRGMSYAEAVKMMLKGFAAEVIQRITHEKIRQHISEVL